ncbi:MAG TPA: hypothetical protein VFE51_15445 [Verrucomicrobiae bacterium]|nr:hypothetical protein [Verrucomicrobiae bacterium]
MLPNGYQVVASDSGFPSGSFSFAVGPERLHSAFAMTTHRLTIHAFVAFLALSCRADTNHIDQAILAFPKLSAWEFRPDEAVRSANILIAAGRESACSALKRIGNAKWEFPEDYKVDQKVCHLCRFVFAPRTERGLLRAPRLGAPELLPLHSMKDADWPYMPFAIVQDVPLSMTLGYSLEGIPETADSYLTYCMSNGTFRTLLFPMPSTTTASNALHEVLASPAWKALKWKDSGVGLSYTLGEDYAKEMLWKQVENMANKRLQPARR